MIRKKKKRKPIICDNCTRLALAVFDEHNLCAHCLIHADNLDLLLDKNPPISPLPITASEFMDSFGVPN